EGRVAPTYPRIRRRQGSQGRRVAHHPIASSIPQGASRITVLILVRLRRIASMPTLALGGTRTILRSAATMRGLAGSPTLGVKAPARSLIFQSADQRAA